MPGREIEIKGTQNAAKMENSVNLFDLLKLIEKSGTGSAGVVQISGAELPVISVTVPVSKQKGWGKRRGINGQS